MKIIGVQFDYGERNDYDRLARVFATSVAENSPAAELTIATMAAPSEVKKNRGLTSNWAKFKIWNHYVQNATEGEHVVLMDVDMLVTGDLRPAFNESFDVGITRRTSTSWPYNGGVVFLKVNDRSREFIKTWGEIDEMMYHDAKFHAPYAKRYRGQNQASLGWMVENNPAEAQILEFPCMVWNACNEDWMRVDLTRTRAVHIKSTLRHYCLGHTAGVPSKLGHICKLWREIENRAGETPPVHRTVAMELT